MNFKALVQNGLQATGAPETEPAAFENPLLPWSGFKAWIAFTDKKTRTFYSRDSVATLKQLQHRRIDPVTLDREQGYLGLIKMIERYRGKYKVARILSAYKDGHVYREYKAGVLVLQQDPDFSHPKTVLQSRYTLSTDQKPFLLEVSLNTRGKEIFNIK